MKVAALFLALQFVAIFPTSVYSQDGTLDSLFGENGFVTTSFGTGHDAGFAISVQPDGKIVVAGQSGANVMQSSIALARYLPDGSLDNSFGAAGKVVTSVGSNNQAYATCLAITPAGKILAGGNAYHDSDHYFTLVQYQSNGNLDQGFGAGGVVLTNVVDGDNFIESIAVLPDGKIMVAGHSEKSFSDSDFSMARYFPDGSLDPSFGSGGILSFSFGLSNDYCRAMAIQADGKIVLAGNSGTPGNFDFALARFHSDGSLDESFGDNGRVITDFGGQTEYLSSVVIQDDGKILVGGHAGSYMEYDLAMARYNTDGTADLSFGNGGKVFLSIGEKGETINALDLQADGKILAAGDYSDGIYSKVFLTRVLSQGDLDSGFGAGGIATTSFGNFHDWAGAIAVLPDAKALLAGSSMNDQSNYDMALARYLIDLNIGTIDFAANELHALVYPNPVEGAFALRYELLEKTVVHFRLSDAQGRIVSDLLSGVVREKGAHEEQFDISGLLAGAYFLSIETGEGGKLSIQIVK